MPEAPYGSWASPITTDLIVAASIGVDELMLDGQDLYWLESRPKEGGRSVIVRCASEGTIGDVTPPASAGSPSGNNRPFNVRTRVHEYGGGAYFVSGGTAYFSEDNDRKLYRQRLDEPPVAVATSERCRHADVILDQRRNRLIAIREDHTREGSEPINSIVAISLDGTGEERVLTSGNDFYAAPRLSPDGGRFAWLEWHHPNMPWDGTELWVARIAGDGGIGTKRKIAGGDAESIFQPEWSPRGELYFVSDRTNWWNLYRVTGDPLDPTSATEPLHAMEAEFGRPQWGFRMSTYAFESERRLICTYSRNGLSALATIDLDSLAFHEIRTRFTDIATLRAARGYAYFRGGSPTTSPAVIELALDSGEVTIIRSSDADDLSAFAGYIAAPEPIEFPTENGLSAHALFYAPRNRDVTGPADERPPLIVHSHGGPTAQTSSTLNWRIQFWTSRGFAVLDVNYGGSTGYGRAYRQRLNGNWGIVDVDDCANGARYLAKAGRVDGKRMAIRGGSAGGYTTLSALTFRDVFAAGASHYGVADLEALAKDTHKFESRYLDSLVGPYPARRDLYRERSPVHFSERLSVPIAFFQGAEDAIVPPSQAEQMVEALRAKGVPYLYLLFDGEQHGFRRAENIKRALDAELYFYSVFLTRTKLTFPVTKGQ